MPKSKYNWEALKTEYLAGDIKDASVFFRNKYNIPKHKAINANIIIEMKGWYKDWKKYKERVAMNALKKIEKKQTIDLAEALEDIHYFLKDYAKIARNTRGKNGLAKVDDVKHVWDMLRTENGLPTKITHSKVETVSDPEDAVGKLLEDE